MAKLKLAETLSLDTEKQTQVANQAKKLRKRIKSGKISVQEQKPARTDVAQSRGLMYIGHIPHGFYEIQMKNYFQQFGVVTNVKLCRSGRSGKSKGYGYVEFSHPEVAKIAAETMNNYLMFKKKLIVEYVPFEKRPRGLFKGKRNTPTRYSSKSRRRRQMTANIQVDEQTHLRRSSARLSNLNKKLQKLQKAGVDCDVKPVDLPDGIKQEKLSDEAVIHTHQPDPYDSDIEIKVPLKESRKSVRSVVRTSSKSTPNKSKGSVKSKLDDGNSPTNKMFFAKSLDSVKGLISSKNTNKLSSSKSVQKANKATSISMLKAIKSEKLHRGGISKKGKELNKFNAETIKKIARELIRKRGRSLLNVVTAKRGVSKIKSSKNKISV